MHINVKMLVVTLKEELHAPTHAHFGGQRPQQSHIQMILGASPSTAFSEVFCDVWTLFPATPGSVIGPICEHHCLQTVPSVGQNSGPSHQGPSGTYLKQ